MTRILWSDLKYDSIYKKHVIQIYYVKQFLCLPRSSRWSRSRSLWRVDIHRSKVFGIMLLLCTLSTSKWSITDDMFSRWKRSMLTSSWTNVTHKRHLLSIVPFVLVVRALTVNGAFRHIVSFWRLVRELQRALRYARGGLIWRRLHEVVNAVYNGSQTCRGEWRYFPNQWWKGWMSKTRLSKDSG